MKYTREYFIEKIREIAIDLLNHEMYGINDKKATVLGYVYDRPQAIAMYYSGKHKMEMPYYPPEFRTVSHARDTADRYIRRAIEQIMGEPIYFDSQK